MKVLFQSDDYGITRACALGAIEGIRNGVIRNTGLFANMPWVDEVYEWIKPYLNEIAFGIDLNASTGPSILGHDKVPHLTHEDGMLLGSGENRALDNDENDHDHLAAHYDELYAEFDAQIQKYISLTGHKPDYIHNHAYGTKTTDKVTHDLAVKYQCITSAGVMNHKDEVAQGGMGWYVFGGPEKQLTEDPLGYITNDKSGMLASGKPYGYVVCHCGYADAEIFRLSSFNVCRTMDLDCMCSDELKKWVKENKIELISFKDLPQEWIEK